MGRKDREARVAFAGGVGGTECNRWGKPEAQVGREETKGSRAAGGRCCHAAMALPGACCFKGPEQKGFSPGRRC